MNNYHDTPLDGDGDGDGGDYDDDDDGVIPALIISMDIVLTKNEDATPTFQIELNLALWCQDESCDDSPKQCNLSQFVRADLRHPSILAQKKHKRTYYTLKTESFHDASFVVTDGTGGCRYENLWCC